MCTVGLRDGTAWSNFWGSFSDTWSYKRSTDYANILTRTVSMGSIFKFYPLTSMT